MKRFFLLLALVLPLIAGCSKNNDNATPSEPSEEQAFPQHEGFYRIYAVDQTGWDALCLYMYGSTNNLGGSWPGMKPSGTLTVKGQPYTYFQVSVDDAAGQKEQLIFNNGAGVQIPSSGEPSVAFAEKADLFFTVTADKATALNITTEWTVDTTPKPVTAEAKKVQTLPASSRIMGRIYQVNPKLYGASGAFGKIQARLDDIAALGTDIFYLMPVYEQGKVKSIGSPYCIKDFTAINTSYGTLDELKSLVDAAHEKGMKVLFDWVANHTAWDCNWTTDHKDWYAQDSSGNIVCPTADGTWTDVAQLNYESKDLRAAMTGALQYWISEVGIDGYRCDYAHGPSGSKSGPMDEFWKEAIPALEQLQPGLIMLAESDFTKMYDDGFDMIFSRSARSRLMSGFGKDLTAFFSTISQALNSAPATGSPLLFVTNHDEYANTTPVSDFNSKEGARAAFLLMRALPAATMLYGPQEIAYNATIDFCRTLTLSWTSDTAYLTSMKEALTALGEIDRTQACDIYVAGPAAVVNYGGHGLMVNTAAAETTVTGLKTVTGDEQVVLPGYGYRIF